MIGELFKIKNNENHPQILPLPDHHGDNNENDDQAVLLPNHEPSSTHDHSLKDSPPTTGPPSLDCETQAILDDPEFDPFNNTEGSNNV